MMTGRMPAIPRISTSAVDVRDVADLHLRATINPAAKGEPSLAVAGEPTTFPEIAALLKTRMPNAAQRVSTKVLPNWVVRLGVLVNPSLKEVAPQLDWSRNASNEKATRVLGWAPRSNERSVLYTAESLVRFGLLGHPATGSLKGR
jgi:nucleoside-diphosphate-sugar epimerase